MPQGVADQQPGSSDLQLPLRVQAWLLLGGTTLVTLGSLALFGWLTQYRGLGSLFPGLPAMPMSTAILFCGCGVALALLTSSRRWGLLLALGVELLALVVLTPHLLGVTLGIDQALAVLWPFDGYTVPGWYGCAVPLSFAFAAGALILLFLKSTPGTLRFAHLLAILTLGVSACSAVGLALGLDANVFRGLSIPTIGGLLLLGSSLLITVRHRTFSASADEVDPRIASVNTLLLVSDQDKSRTMQSLLAFQRAVFEQAPDGILVANHEGRILEANERIAKLFGYSRESLKGKQIEELVPQSVRSQHHQHRAMFQKAPSTRVMSRDRTLQGQRADGSEFPIEVALAPMTSEDGDRVIAIVKDVSEARQAEQALRDALIEKDRLLRENDEKSRAVERLHAFQRAVFEQAPDGILVADEEGLIVEANERMASLFGYSREGLAGRRIEDLVPQQVRAAHLLHRAAFQQAPSTRIMSRDRTLNGQRSDGTEFPIEVALAPLLTTDGKRVIAIVKDVTEARQSERLIRDALKEKDLLLGEIHHRVKNNLQIVHSLLDMQAEMTTDAGAASALRDSQARIQSMALIHQTLYQSHDFAKVDFGVFLDTLMSHQQSSHGRGDLSLSSRSDTVRLAIDRAIPCGLIVNELVTNALKHAFPEHRHGSVLVEMRLLEGDRVEVAVIDDGVGIPESVNLKALSSLGMQLVQVLSEQLHAELTVQRRNPTRISFSFSLQ